MLRARVWFYRPRASPLHVTRAGVAALWALCLVAVALVLTHPLALLALGAAVLFVGAGAGVSAELLRTLRAALLLGIPIVLVNVLVSRQGITVFARLGSLGPFGQGDLTTEALIYGCVIALKFTVLILITTLASLAIDPDELLRIARRLSFRAALTASLSLRMIPLLVADAQRLAEAQTTRAAGRPRGPRGRFAVLAAVVGGSLDRAMDVAATLEVRGFATARRASRRLRPWSRHDLAFAASAVCAIAVALSGASAVSLHAYPRLRIGLSAMTAVVCLVLLVVVALPVCDRRGIQR
jgi:energy-coupling factor transport system permease protein